MTWRVAWSVTLFLGVCTVDPSAVWAQSGGAKKEAREAQSARRSLFKIYRGMEPRRVSSQSAIDSAHSSYAIGKVLQGDLVSHEFRISNDTNQPIDVENLKMCSNCILESYSEEIRPGLEGSISFVVPTDSLGGQSLAGTITGETSSPDLPTFAIDVTLDVQEFAALEPYRVWLKGSPESEIVETCVIVPNENYPFAITEIRARKGVWFEHSFSEGQRAGKKVYEVKIKNTRTKPGPYQDVLFVRTDHPERPEFKIRIEGRIEE